MKTRLDLEVTERSETRVSLALRGEVAERSGATGQLVRATLLGGMRFDPIGGRLVEGWTEVRRRTMEGVSNGYRRGHTTIVAWQPGDPAEPADLPVAHLSPPN